MIVKLSNIYGGEKKLDFTKCPYNVYSELFNHFDEKVANCLFSAKTNEQNFYINDVIDGIVNKFDKNALAYIIDKIKNHEAFFKRGELEVDIYKKLISNKYLWNENRKIRNNIMFLRHQIEEAFPNVIKQTITDTKNIFLGHTFVQSILKSLEKNIDIKTPYIQDEMRLLNLFLDKKNIFSISENYIKINTNGHKSPWEHYNNILLSNVIETKNIITLEKLLNYNQKLKSQWNNFNQEMEKQQNCYTEYINSYICSEKVINFEDAEFFNILENLHLTVNNQQYAYKLFNNMKKKSTKGI